MDNRQRFARIALLTAEVERQGVCARTGKPLTVESAVLFVRRAPWEDNATRTVMTGAEWDNIGDRARMIAAAKGQTVRVIDGRDLHRGQKEIEMRQRRLKLAEVNGETHIELQSLLTSMRETPRLRDAADEIEFAVLRHKIWKDNGRVIGSGVGENADRVLAA